jgi:hypothetical protein
MMLRTAVIGLALALAGCNQQNSASQDGAGGAPQLDAPTSESQPSSVFEPANDAARTATGQLTMSVSLHLPDAGQDGADAQEVLTLRGATGVVVEAAITGDVSPATQVQGQTLRALLDIPVEEPRVLVYRVASEVHPEGVRGLCGETQTAHVVVWEPSVPGEASMKVLGVTGGAPGAAASRACPMLAYSRG